MDEVGTVVLEVKDIDWEGSHTIPTFDDVKVEELTAENYMGNHDIDESIVDSKAVIESIVIGSTEDSVKEIVFSPMMKSPLKSDSLDIKEMIKLDSVDDKDSEMMDSSDGESPAQSETKVKKSQPKFNCDLCNIKFLSYYSLQVHIRRHMGYKPFACELCEQAYPTRTQLVRHMKNHTNKLEHFCGECGKSSLDISTLKKHATFKHAMNQQTYNLYRIKEEVTKEGEKVIFIKTFRNGKTNIRRFRLVPESNSNAKQICSSKEENT